MLENRSYTNPSNPPKPQDQRAGLSNSIDVLRRSTLSHLIRFLSRLSVASSISLIIGCLVIVVYTGYRLGQSSTRALPRSSSVLQERSQHVAEMVPRTQTA